MDRSFVLLLTLFEAVGSQLYATRDELSDAIPPDLPCLLTMDAWCAPDVCGGEIPSQTECMTQIADVIVHQDPARYQPTQPANSGDWSFWMARKNG
jgi:hypothetical protein